MPPKVGTRFMEDKCQYRTGWLVDEEVTKKIIKSVADTRAVIGKDQVAKKVTLNEKMLLEQIDILRVIFQIAYPEFKGLGVWEPARAIVETKDLECFYNPDDLDVIFILL